jgi:hypothetical protein
MFTSKPSSHLDWIEMAHFAGRSVFSHMIAVMLDKLKNWSRVIKREGLYMAAQGNAWPPFISL